MSKQNIPNLQVCSLYETESKGVNADKILLNVCYTDESESKRGIVNACCSDESKSKSVHISIDTNEVLDVINETKDEETFVTNNSVIVAPLYFEIL